jgi:hypothetical protein
MALIEKKCREDIEAVRQEERKKSAQEIQKIKDIFLLREKETTEDLMSLEELHASHVEKLVSQSLHNIAILTFPSPLLSCPILSSLVLSTLVLSSDHVCSVQREEISQSQMQLHQLTHDHKQIRATHTRKEEEHKKEIERLDQKLKDELSRAESLEAAMKQVSVIFCISCPFLSSLLSFPASIPFSCLFLFDISFSLSPSSRSKQKHKKQNFKSHCIEINSKL